MGKCKPRVLITHDDRATLKLSDNMLYGQRNNVRCLMETMRELPAHPSALLVHKVSEDIRVVDENLDRDERCVLTSSGHFCLEPNGEARINFGVSLKAPVGTKITLSPTHSDKRELWDLISHNAELDKTGELIAWVRNYSNAQIIIADKTHIASVHVSRIRAGESARKKSDKVQKLIRKGNSLTSDIAKNDTMMVKWMSQIQNKLTAHDHCNAIEDSRKELYDLQKKWLAKELNPRTISIQDPDTEKGGRYDVVRINGVRVKTKGKQKEMFTNIAFMNPTFMTLSWNFIIPKEVVAQQKTRTQKIEKLLHISEDEREEKGSTTQVKFKANRRKED